jgi:uncharacterized membrane protein
MSANPPLHIGDTVSLAFDTFVNNAVTLIVGGLVAMLVAIFSLGICGPPMAIGYTRVALRAARGETPAIGDIFEGFQYFLQSWLLFLVIGFAVTLGTTCLIIPGVILAYLLFWAPMFMADGNKDAFDCIKRSFEYNKESDNLGPVVVFYLVYIVIMNIGNAVALGGIVTIPVAYAMQAHGYLRAFTGEQAPVVDATPDPI